MRWLVLAVVVLSVGAGGCAREIDTSEPPAELQVIDERLEIQRIWTAQVGGASERLRLGLTPATDGARIYAGSYDGEAASFDAQTGQRQWVTQTELQLSAGPAYGAGVLAFGTTDGELIALDAESGEELWRRAVGAEVLAPPAIGGDVVAMRSVDGRLRGYAVQDGRELWSVEQTVPALTMRGNTAPSVAGTAVVSGFDNGRLVDISAGLQVVGNNVFAVGYNGRALGVALETGSVLWEQELSSYSGLGVDLDSVYVTDEFSEVVALDRGAGTPRWRQNALRLRDLTAPSAYANTIVVGDFEGYLHWIDPRDGSFLARERVSQRSISAAPLVVGANLFAQAEDGTVAAYTALFEEPEPEPADDPA